VTYLDTSVVLAQLFAEDRRPPDDLWTEPLIASRLLLYEVWTRVHSRGLTRQHDEAARSVLDAINLVELTPMVLSRALEPFPVAVRTLDALHLASMEFLRGQGRSIELASYDQRLITAARALGIPLRAL
jgi:predicted nucleic acid-binding protein